MYGKTFVRIRPHPDSDGMTSAEIRAALTEAEEKLRLSKELPDEADREFVKTHAVQEIRQLQAALAARHNGKSPAETNALYRRFAEIEAEHVTWLWPGRIPRGKLSVIAGHPDLGKSQVALDIIARLTTAKAWPDGGEACKLGQAIILSAEDDAADTIKPRLVAAGADTSRVYILDAIREVTDNGGELRRMFNLAADLDRLEVMVKEVGGVDLIIIDPVSAYLSGVDSHKNADVRAALGPLGDFAARLKVAMLAISHLTKHPSADAQALLRVSGSLAFVAAPRTAWLVARDPENPDRRLFLRVKNNLMPDQGGLAFAVQGVTLASGLETSCVAWEKEPVSMTADEAMNPDTAEKQTALGEARDFLKAVLPLSPKEIEAEAKAAGIAWRTIRRAKDDLGIQARQLGFHGGWIWELPASQMSTKTTDVQDKNVDNCDQNGHLCESKADDWEPGSDG